MFYICYIAVVFGICWLFIVSNLLIFFLYVKQ